MHSSRSSVIEMNLSSNLFRAQFQNTTISCNNHLQNLDTLPQKTSIAKHLVLFWTNFFDMQPSPMHSDAKLHKKCVMLRIVADPVLLFLYDPDCVLSSAYLGFTQNVMCTIIVT